MLGGLLRCVAVLVRDRPADLAALDHAIEVARSRHARLLVILAPRLSRSLASFALWQGLGPPVDQVEDAAIGRCRALVLARVPQDLPVTIRVVSNAHLTGIARVLVETGPELVIAPPSDGESFRSSLWYLILAQRYQTAYAKHWIGSLTFAAN